MSESLASKINDLSLSSADGTLSNPDEFAELKAPLYDLIKRAKKLCEEVDLYAAAVETHHKLGRTEKLVQYHVLQREVESELATLEKMVAKDLPAKKVRHFIASVNLPFHEGLWDAAKRSTGLLGFRQYFFCDANQKIGFRGGTSRKNKGGGEDKSTALVDIVASDGDKWVRISSVSEKRMIFELANLGWRSDSEDEDEDEEDDGDTDNDDDQVEIVKTARQLARAAQANLLHGRPPKVQILLPRIEFGKRKEIDAIIQKVCATGATVECANDFSLKPAPLPILDILPALLVGGSRSFSETLNVDCTRLIALVSDISHRKHPTVEWYHAEKVREQIVQEAQQSLLPTLIYPAIGSHPMVCTQEAAKQTLSIVNQMGTTDERLRAMILLGEGDHANTPSEKLIEEWISMSEHPIPEGFRLPIQVVDGNLEANMRRLPKIAEKIAPELSLLNRGIFFYGWAESLTTLSGNREVAKLIEELLNKYGLEDGEAGPQIWLCGKGRSLIAKERKREEEEVVGYNESAGTRPQRA